MIRTAQRLLIFALGASLLLSPLGCAASPVPTLHENPTDAQPQYDLSELMSSYSSFFNQLIQGKYQDLDKLLIDLAQANLGADIIDQFLRYNDLSQQLLQTLDQVEKELNTAEGLIGQNRLGEAAAKLDQASKLIDSVALVPAEISALTRVIGQALGIPALADSSTLKQDFEGLSAASGKLNQAIERLASLRQRLVGQGATAETTLAATSLSISFGPNPVFVGDAMTVSGRLGDKSGRPLTGRAVSLTLGATSTTANTDELGFYTASLTAPLEYAASTSLQAKYLPQGTDLGIFAASASQILAVGLNYYTTQFNATLPARISPGLTFSIPGRLFSSGPSVPRQVQFWAGEHLINTTTVSGADFAIQLTVSGIAPGIYDCRLVAVPQGRYADATTLRSIDVSLIPTQVHLSPPRFLFIPGPLELPMQISSDDAVWAGASIRLSYGDVSRVLTAPRQGIFPARLDMPFKFTLFGSQKFRIEVQPVNPWDAPAVVETQIIVINPVNYLAALLPFMAVIAVLVINIERKRRWRQTPVGAGMRPGQVSGPDASPKNIPGIIESEGGILSAYDWARRLLSAFTGMADKPSATLREFRERVVIKLWPRLKDAFSELTLMAEITLYSRLKPDNDHMLKARQLEQSIRKEVRR